MRSSILLLVLSATVFAGCSSAYKTGQTPDDVYFSPERQRDEYVNVQDKNDASRYYEDENYTDDQYLQMKVHNRVMWSELDDWYYYTPSPSYGYYNTWNWASPWNPYIAWNYYYNPYCTPVILSSHSSMVYNHPRVFNLNTYNSTLLNNNNYTNPKGGIYNPSYSNPYSKPVKMVGVGNSNNSSGAGNFLRNVFNGSSNSNSSSSGSVGGRSSGSSSGSSGGGGHSGGGGGAGVRRF